MAHVVIENLIINPPFVEPARKFLPDRDAISRAKSLSGELS